jgi:hypothetical protein
MRLLTDIDADYFWRGGGAFTTLPVAKLYIASNYRTIDELESILEGRGRGRGLIEALSSSLSGGAEENHENTSVGMADVQP